jgi:hypothetical protein
MITGLRLRLSQAVALRGAPTTARRHVPVPRGGVGGGGAARRGVSNLPPGHRVADGFRWADRDESGQVETLE